MKGTMENIEAIASVCHEANRAFCATLGDNSQPPWTDAPEWQKVSAINGVRFHLAAHADGRIPSPSASHDSWLAQKASEGWKYGPIKNVDIKEHPCFVSYEELPVSQRIKDYIFGAIVKAFHDAGSER